ncbi:MAG: PKD domain-containing protein [Flavobacteriales bacterium]|nr:PKD domain-containing protein [Flavobacteriales bacterium]
MADIGPPDPCNGQTITFTNLSDTFAVGYQWNFGDPTSTTDVSTIRNPPPYTYPGLGPYTVSLIVQPGTACADTAYEVVNIGTVNADFTAVIDSACVGVPFNFTDNSSTSPNDTIQAWMWYFGDGGTSSLPDPSYTYADSGIYTVKLIATSGLGCMDSVSKDIYAQKPPVATGVDTNACSNNPDAFLNGSVQFAGGGTWSGAGTFNTQNSLPTIYTPVQSEIDSGYADVWLITTGNGLCPADSDLVHIDFTPAPTVDIGPDSISVCKDTSAICFTASITIATGGTWSTSGSGGFLPDADSLNICYVPDSADFASDSIVLYFTTTGNADCNAVTDSVWIHFIDEPVVNIVSNDSTCAGIDFPISVNTSTGSGTWITLGDGSFLPDPNVLNPTYSPGTNDNASGNVCLIFVSSNNGLCRPVTDTLCITLVSQPQANGGADTSSCSNNAAIQLIGSVQNAGGGIWTGPGTFSPPNVLNPVYTPTNGGITLGFEDVELITTGNGLCPADTDVVRITFTPAPTADIGLDTLTVCKDVSGVDLVGTISIASGGKWSTNGDGTFQPHDSSLAITYVPGANDLQSTQVWLYLTTTGNGECLAVKDSILLDLVDAPVVNITAADTSCAGVCIPLTVNTSTGSGVWTTLGSGTFVPNANVTNPFYCPGATDDLLGSVTLVFESTNNGLCNSVSDTVTIGLVPGPQADFISNDNCIGDSTQFMDNSTKGFGNINTWSWFFGDGNVSGQPNPIHLYNAQTTYNVIYIVKDDRGCADTIQKDVFVHPLPDAEFLYTPGCLGEPVIFVDTSQVADGDSVITWYWQFGDGDTSTLQNPTHIYPVNGGYPVTLIVSSNVGCSDTVINGITVLAPPNADFTMDKTLLKLKEPVSFTDLSTGGIGSWFWDFGDGNTDTDQNPVHSYDQDTGVYTIMLIVTDLNGCVDTAYKTLEIYQPPAIPNAFTPNGDGTNDEFFIRGGPFRFYELKVYNNWGELIFLSNNQANKWDGTRDGIEQPMGVYVYTAVVISEDGVKDEFRGDVTLLR